MIEDSSPELGREQVQQETPQEVDNQESKFRRIKNFFFRKNERYFRSAHFVPSIFNKNYKIMNLSLILFLIGILGFVLNRKNIILMLISIEIMLLSITFLILISSLSFDDIVGQTFSIYIIAIAGAESAIGLGILVAYYRLRGSISIEYN